MIKYLFEVADRDHNLRSWFCDPAELPDELAYAGGLHEGGVLLDVRLTTLFWVEWSHRGEAIPGTRIYANWLAYWLENAEAGGCGKFKIDVEGVLTPRIVITKRGSHIRNTAEIVCSLVWDGHVPGLTFDRCRLHICLNAWKSDEDVAEAYRQAVADGKIYSKPTLVQDIHGGWYVTCTGFTTGTYLAQDLRELGYLPPSERGD